VAEGQAAPAEGGAFLRRAARLAWLVHCRGNRRQARALADLAAQAWQRECEPDDGDAFVDAVARCLPRLTPRTREALEAVYVDGTDRAAVASRLGLGDTGLKTLLQRARRALLECIRRTS
jgi:DNA-directed RNA polymerase specialized sigma24 family protein